jgi:hypothetical protein
VTLAEKKPNDYPPVGHLASLFDQPHIEAVVLGGSNEGRVHVLVDTGARISLISTGMLKRCGIQ